MREEEGGKREREGWTDAWIFMYFYYFFQC